MAMTAARAAFQASYDAGQSAAQQQSAYSNALAAPTAPTAPAPAAPTSSNPQADFYNIHQQSQISGVPTNVYNQAVSNLGFDTNNTFSGIKASDSLQNVGYYTGKPTAGAILEYGDDKVEGGNALYQVGGDAYKQALAGTYIQDPMNPTNTNGYSGTQQGAIIPFSQQPSAQPANALTQNTAVTSDQVAQSFRDILGREAPQSYIDGVVASGMTPEQVAMSISQSPEALKNAQTGAYTPPQGSIPSVSPIADTPSSAPSTTPLAPGAGQYTDESVNDLVNYYFQTELGRDANPEGAKWWADQLQSGAITEEQMRNSIKDIAREAGELPVSDKLAVKNIFETGFGDDMTNAELEYWSKELASGNLTLAELPQAMAASGEDFDLLKVQENYYDISRGQKPEEQFSYNEKDERASLGYDPKEEFKFNEEDPSYQFRKSEAMKAIERGAASRGMALSGRALKEAERYASDLASQEYNAEYNRWNADRLDRFNLSQTQQQNAYNQQMAEYNLRQNQLINLANMGIGAMGQTQQAGGQYAGQVGSNMMAAGNAQAAGAIGAGQAQATAMGNVAGAAQSGIGNYLNYDMYNKYLNNAPADQGFTQYAGGPTWG